MSIYDTTINKKKTPIDYTKRGFNEIRDELISYIKRYYPNSYKDFNASSFGSLMIDLMSYLGDQLHYYIDHNANEANPVFAKEAENVIGHLMPYGLKIRKPAAPSLVDLYVPFPAKDSGVGIDENYEVVVLSSSEYKTQGGNIFSQTEDVLVNASTADIIGHKLTDDGSSLSYYILKVPVPVKSGVIRDFSVDIGDPRKFLKIEIPDANISEIIKVEDSEGNEYIQVDNLSIDTVLTPLVDLSAEDGTTKVRMKNIPAPRRFVVEESLNKTYIQFGYGSDEDLSTNSLVDPSKPLLKQAGMKHISTPRQNPYNIFTSNALGVAPQDTTITVTYRSNSTLNVNAAVGTLNQIVTSRLSFTNEQLLDSTKTSYIRENIEVYNEEPINGFVSIPNTEELKMRYLGNYAAQARAVTKQDYISSVYSMPTAYGSVKRAAIIRDTNDLRRNLNLYLLAEGADGKFEAPSILLKQNVKTWLDSLRMISDSIDIMDAKIINLGLDIKVQVSNSSNSQSLLAEIKTKLFEELMTIPPNIGESFYISEVHKILGQIPEIINVPIRDGVMVRNLVGNETHSTYSYDVLDNMSLDESYIYVPENSIWEIKYIDDIRATIVGR